MAVVAVVYGEQRDEMPNPPASVDRACAICSGAARFIVHHVEGEIRLLGAGARPEKDALLAGQCPECGVVHLACAQPVDHAGSTSFRCASHNGPGGELKAGLAFVEMQI